MLAVPEEKYRDEPGQSSGNNLTLGFISVSTGGFPQDRTRLDTGLRRTLNETVYRARGNKESFAWLTIN